MWDYNGDGIIDERDEDEYWDDIYFEENVLKRRKAIFDLLGDDVDDDSED